MPILMAINNKDGMITIDETRDENINIVKEVEEVGVRQAVEEV